MSEGLAAVQLLGPMALPVIAGWRSQHQVTLQLPGAGGAGDFEPSIVIVQEALAVDATLASVVNERRRALARHLPQFELDISIQSQLCGHEAVRLLYSWHSGPHRLRQMLVLLPLPGTLYTFTYTDLSSRFADTIGAFDTWLALVGFVEDPGAAPITEAAGERSP